MLLFAADAQSLDMASDRLSRALPAQMERMRVDLGSAEERFARAMPVQMERRRLEAEATRDRLVRAGRTLNDRFAYQMRRAASRLADLSPVNTLARGYSITRNEEGAIVRHVGEAPAGTKIEVTVSDGTLDCEVVNAKQGKDS